MNVTLGDVCSSYVKPPWQTKAKHRRRVPALCGHTVFAAWKGKPIVGITEAEVRKRHRDMVDGGLDGKASCAGERQRCLRHPALSS